MLAVVCLHAEECKKQEVIGRMSGIFAATCKLMSEMLTCTELYGYQEGCGKEEIAKDCMSIHEHCISGRGMQSCTSSLDVQSSSESLVPS
jgi:hypothetical protein